MEHLITETNIDDYMKSKMSYQLKCFGFFVCVEMVHVDSQLNITVHEREKEI